MKLRTLSYLAHNHLGNNEYERIELTADLDENDDFAKVLEDLKIKVQGESTSMNRYYRMRNDICKSETQLDELNEKLQKAQQNWQMMSTFMVAQGLKKPDEVPDLPKLLGASPDDDDAIDGEIDDDDDDEDD
ncbi:MAG: hypothetical protein KME17_08105 [Cyanosarcina radialis HA8281-LM2]|jgi:type I restriction-modification system DNA methylase subunit|nr:hypothetical protein [Cyanosarcina radialis HA8281-LM2]